MRRLWLRILAAILLVMCGVLPNGQPASAAAAWDSPLSLSTENGFLGVRYGGGEWLAMGMSNTIAVSTDGGSNWNVYYPSGGVNEWTDAVYNGSGWVMVGTGGKIFTTKGSLAATKGNWTQRTSGATVNLWGIAFNGSRYVAVGDGGRVLYSDDQVNWTQGIMPGTGNLTGIVWSNDRYVAVSDSGNVYVSLDGAMWTKPYTATAPLYGVTYGNNMFVAVGAQVSAVSSDGGTWASGTATGNLTSVTYTNDQFVAAAEGGHIFSSADGKTWTDTGSASTTQDLLAVQYAAEQKRTITVGGDATTAVIRMQEENNSDLYKLTLSAGTLTPAFKPEIPAYTAAVTSDVTEITVTPTAQSSKATLQLKINGGSFAATASGVPSVKLPLDVGSNTIVVRVTAGDGVTFTDYTITVNRERPNYPPTAISLSNAVVAENEPAGKVIGTLGATDPDPGETFTYELKGTDASAFLIVGNMLNTKQPFDYETKPSYSIIIVVKDGKGAAFEQPFTITVTNVNEPPTVSNATKTGAEDQTTVFAVTDFGSYFVDADQGDSLKMLKILSLPANGKLKLNGVDVTVNQEVPAGQIATLQFVPNENWSGTTTFDWNASDGTFYASTQATMTLVLSEINDLPVVENSARSGMEDQAIAFGLNDFANYYKDIESALSKVQITGVPDNGKLLLTGTQVTLNQEIAASDLSKLVYLPNPNWYGEDRFGWKGSDGTDYSANSASVTLTISAVNDPPTVKNSSKTGVEDAELPLTAADFSGNYEDVEIDGLTKVQIVSLPAHAALKLDGVIVSANQEILANDLDKLRIVPDQDWNGTTGLDWKGHDGNSYSTVAATMSITITSLPDLPLVQNGAVDGQEDTDLVLGAGPFQQNYSDADGESLTKVMMVTLPENGGLTLNGVPVTAGMEIDTADLAQLKYTPAADFHGNDSIRWKGHDGTGFSTDAATMTLRIAAVNDLPSVIDSSMNGNEDEPIIFAESDFAKAFIDVDKDQLAKVQIVTLPVNGSLQLNGTDLLANAEIDAADLHKLAYVPDAEWYGA
ncbi:MAG: tandem-95 repeat protein, partial [Clostridia bacterium]